MTDVIILRAIPGHAKGAVTPLTERLRKHVESGNAALLPGRHDHYGEQSEAPAQVRPILTQITGDDRRDEPVQLIDDEN